MSIVASLANRRPLVPRPIEPRQLRTAAGEFRQVHEDAVLGRGEDAKIGACLGRRSEPGLLARIGQRKGLPRQSELLNIERLRHHRRIASEDQVALRIQDWARRGQTGNGRLPARVERCDRRAHAFAGRHAEQDLPARKEGHRRRGLRQLSDLRHERWNPSRRRHAEQPGCTTDPTEKHDDAIWTPGGGSRGRSGVAQGR